MEKLCSEPSRIAVFIAADGDEVARARELEGYLADPTAIHNAGLLTRWDRLPL
eukprot:CAMPEP_0117525722 /NCGR_PEP_ID=MMETSP0784-20121206/35918_1 /TAXON_ID=39447 /ORGANISM="" /LENGTH=52 /DNA_ID=CAMNT_0005321931 /DNA_START=457 /DNA_END=615 /DNA_ORIENTATION=+